MLSLQDQWVWDFWLTQSDGLWHIYFLQADKSLGNPELRHWNVSQGHATSSDLVNWELLGTSLRPQASPAWDDCTTWTGSVVQDEAKLWHLFYTGTCRAEDGLKQRIGHATSTDMHHWARVGSGLALDLDVNHYEEYTPGHWHDRAMRDPWVMRDPEGDGWLMYFTARVAGVTEPNAGGAIGLARSSDLVHWTQEAPVFQGDFGQLEVPQVFQVGERWYCVFCNAANHWSKGYAASYPGTPVTGVHYLVAEHHLGPWRVAPGPFLTGRLPAQRYAGKIVDTGKGLALMAFLHDDENGQFIGEVMDPIPLSLDPQGLFVPV